MKTPEQVRLESLRYSEEQSKRFVAGLALIRDASGRAPHTDGTLSELGEYVHSLLYRAFMAGVDAAREGVS